MAASHCKVGSSINRHAETREHHSDRRVADISLGDRLAEQTYQLFLVWPTVGRN